MKHISIYIIILVLLSSCTLNGLNHTNKENIVSQPVQIKESCGDTVQYNKYYQVYTLEGCEYIVISSGNGQFSWGTHKGNCKNSSHHRK